MPENELTIRAQWRAADAVCFDVDSTVCMDEAIDELARFAGKEKEVTEMTLKAMRGGMTFHEALTRRLDLIQPSRTTLTDYLRTHPPRLTTGIKELVSELHIRGVPVYLVSGGFRTIIEPVAELLDIPKKNIFANNLKFYFNGNYAGFDETEPTCHQNGKAEVIAYLKEHFGYERIVMIGDGATDLAACPPAKRHRKGRIPVVSNGKFCADFFFLLNAFIGFGGNQVREKVKEDAKWFVTSFQELTDELRRN